MKPPTSAVAAAITAITLAVSGVVMAGLDDGRPMIVRSASDAAPFYEPAPTTEEVDTTTTTEGEETSATTARRIWSSSPVSTTGTATVEAEEGVPVEETTTTTTTPTPPTTADRDAADPPLNGTTPDTTPEEPTTTTTTTIPEPTGHWVEVTRFSGLHPQPTELSFRTGYVRCYREDVDQNGRTQVYVAGGQPYDTRAEDDKPVACSGLSPGAGAVFQIPRGNWTLGVRLNDSQTTTWIPNTSDHSDYSVVLYEYRCLPDPYRGFAEGQCRMPTVGTRGNM